jgi:hypothetical protein
MLAIRLLTTNQAVGGSTPSGRANSSKISKIEEIAGNYFPAVVLSRIIRIRFKSTNYLLVRVPGW